MNHNIIVYGRVLNFFKSNNTVLVRVYTRELIGYLSEPLRRNSILIVPGDHVLVEISIFGRDECCILSRIDYSLELEPHIKQMTHNIIVYGRVLDFFKSNNTFIVRVYTREVIGYLSEPLRRNSILIVPGDYVIVEISIFGLDHCCILSRIDYSLEDDEDED
uniref:S1-like domain-containing protein n=1 Tax=Cyphia bulbosa var. bulbosa TaxID=2041115 RepID=A0A291F3C6_9ASTR|nr:hypothetical protein Cyp_bu_bu1Pt0713 [Cyphia bulbosa var. bulbosa]